jgi:hypothetical protein
MLYIRFTSYLVTVSALDINFSCSPHGHKISNFVDLQTTFAKYGLETRFFPNDDIRKGLLVMQRSWTKNAIWKLNRKKWREWCILVSLFLFSNCYGLPVLTVFTTCPNQVFYVWLVELQTIYTRWKRVSLQMMIFVNVCSTCSVVELKTRFESWITRNDANGVNMFFLSYLKTLMAYLCSQWAPNFQIKYFIFY